MIRRAWNVFAAPTLSDDAWVHARPTDCRGLRRPGADALLARAATCHADGCRLDGCVPGCDPAEGLGARRGKGAEQQMSLTDLQAGLMLGGVGGFTLGGVMVFVLHGLAYRRHAKRMEVRDRGE